MPWEKKELYEGECMANTIWFKFDLIRFRKDFSVCRIPEFNSAISAEMKFGKFSEKWKFLDKNVSFKHRQRAKLSLFHAYFNNNNDNVHSRHVRQTETRHVFITTEPFRFERFQGRYYIYARFVYLYPLCLFIYSLLKENFITQSSAILT